MNEIKIKSMHSRKFLLRVAAHFGGNVGHHQHQSNHLPAMLVLEESMRPGRRTRNCYVVGRITYLNETKSEAPGTKCISNWSMERTFVRSSLLLLLRSLLSGALEGREELPYRLKRQLYCTVRRYLCKESAIIK